MIPMAPGKKRHRHKHRNQDDRDADDGTRDLLHRLDGRLFRRKTFLGHDALDVFDNHDRIIDQDTDRKHHREHGQHVDRKPE